MPILSTTMPTVRPRFAGSRYTSWQEAMKDAVRDADELCRLLDLPVEFASAAKEASRQFRLFAPRGFVARMRPGDPTDPLLRQVLPLAEEMADVPGFTIDPVRDDLAERQPGLLHKYQGRVLLVTTGTCAIHCRYCFRRHFPYGEHRQNRQQWQAALDYIQQHPEIQEVILSGGDPLMLTTPHLENLFSALENIPHIQTIRLHSRLPVILPQRI